MVKKTLSAKEESKGLRIDQFLSTEIEELSRNQARKAIQKGSVYIGKKRMKMCSYKMKGSEKITIYFDPLNSRESGSAQPTKAKANRNKKPREKKAEKKRQPKQRTQGSENKRKMAPDEQKMAHRPEGEPRKRRTKRKRRGDTEQQQKSAGKGAKKPGRTGTKLRQNASQDLQKKANTFNVQSVIRSNKKRAPKKTKHVKRPPDDLLLKDKDVVFQDPYIIAVNKPRGIPSQKTRGGNQWTIVQLVEYYLYEKGESNPEVSLVHRLDQNCSGLMVFGRNKPANTSLTEQFRKQTMVKNYLAIVCGVLESTQGVIQTPLSVLQMSSGDKQSKGNDCVVEAHYEVLETFAHYQWISVSPKAGKKHQVRIQCAHHGVPILGDEEYGGESIQSFRENHPNAMASVDVSSPRFLLHAYSLGLKHPKTSMFIELSAPIPNDMKEILNVLRLDS